MMRYLPAALLAAVAASSLAPASGVAQENATLQEWIVPWPNSRPRDPYVAPDGKVWFVGQASHYAAYLDRNTGEFRKFDLDDGTGPHTLVVDDAGIVWYTGNLANHIGRLDPATGQIEKIWMPDEAARDPHTIAFSQDGDMWFTVQGGNFVGFMDKDTRDVELIHAPEVASGRSRSSRPYGIKMDSNDHPWIALFNTNLIATVDPATMEMTTFELPEGARPRRLVITSDDRVWYTDYSRGYLGMLDPTTGTVREWLNPSGEGSRPYGMAVDADDRIWFVESGVQPNKFVGFDPATDEFISVTDVESGGGSVRNMYYERSTNTVWFGTDANTIGKAVLPPLRRNVS
jgi:virginiamycin B lyase